MTDIDLTAAIEAAMAWTAPDIGVTVSRPGESIAGAYEGIIRAALPLILAQVEARVKPTRDEIIAAIRRCNYPDGPIINSISERVAEVSADAVLALLPGRTEAEVREEIAEQIRGGVDYTPEGPFSCYGCPICPDTWESEPTCAHWPAIQWAAGIARGGEGR